MGPISSVQVPIVKLYLMSVGSCALLSMIYFVLLGVGCGGWGGRGEGKDGSPPSHDLPPVNTVNA